MIDPIQSPVQESRQMPLEASLMAQGAILEADILRLVEDDPEGAAKSILGRLHLERYAWLLNHPLEVMGLLCSEKTCSCDKAHSEVESAYPFRFELRDVLLNGDDITLQLLAMEYLEDLGELTPFTLDIIGPRFSKFYDPFTTYQRPAVNIDAMHVGSESRTSATNA